MSTIADLPLLPITSSETIHNCKTFKANNDIYICSYPKSGTTWLQNIIFQLLSHASTSIDELPTELDHISNYSPFYEADSTWFTNKSNYQESPAPKTRDIQGRKMFNTHLRYEMLPKGTEKTRYIYIIRNGKDALTSFYYHLSNQHPDDGGFQGDDFHEFFTQWCKGEIAFGHWTDHLMDFLSASYKDERVLILYYEDLKKDLRAEVKKIIRHCEISIDNENVLDIALKKMSFHYMKENEYMFTPVTVRWKVPNQFIRRGAIGDGNLLFTKKEDKIFHEMIKKYVEKQKQMNIDASNLSSVLNIISEKGGI